MPCLASAIFKLDASSQLRRPVLGLGRPQRTNRFLPAGPCYPSFQRNGENSVLTPSSSRLASTRFTCLMSSASSPARLDHLAGIPLQISDGHPTGCGWKLAFFPSSFPVRGVFNSPQGRGRLHGRKEWPSNNGFRIMSMTQHSDRSVSLKIPLGPAVRQALTRTRVSLTPGPVHYLWTLSGEGCNGHCKKRSEKSGLLFRSRNTLTPSDREPTDLKSRESRDSGRGFATNRERIDVTCGPRRQLRRIAAP
ncbi:uncharacterized protein BDZ83DRAFT_375841 [Colletotrichum acutatum]|uniref:Uncharacterized protein n=1 Tax=Glomerella acutata TaxID=27357 RepID=A0AAD8XNL8_GLOAC|nr:uncharacterized protein BDZ83DRAFT_375841 [Colletotrichum acutatum]KAK1730589.1 hypothetical protein BDZ83DRAFT_375841 [Colletotrichum acutatum]